MDIWASRPQRSSGDRTAAGKNGRGRKSWNDLHAAGDMCKDCGYEKPEDYQYIEIAKVNPRAVICMDSAAWLAGMLKEEPATIAVATARTDRKKWIWKFWNQTFYFQNADVPGEICEKKTEFGSYKYYSPKRTFCDCLRMNNKMPEEVKEEILTWCRKQKYSKEEILEYANKLRAVKNIEEEYQK